MAGRTAFLAICLKEFARDTRWTGKAVVELTDNSPKLSPNN